MYLGAIGQTTNEHIKREYAGKVNPYDKGCLNNYISVCFSAPYPSALPPQDELMSVREYVASCCCPPVRQLNGKAMAIRPWTTTSIDQSISSSVTRSNFVSDCGSDAKGANSAPNGQGNRPAHGHSFHVEKERFRNATVERYDTVHRSYGRVEDHVADPLSGDLQESGIGQPLWTSLSSGNASASSKYWDRTARCRPLDSSSSDGALSDKDRSPGGLCQSKRNTPDNHENVISSV